MQSKNYKSIKKIEPTVTNKYTLSEIQQIVATGFQFIISPEIVNALNNLAYEVLGETNNLVNNTFNSTDCSTFKIKNSLNKNTLSNGNNNRRNKNRRGQNFETNDEEWKTPFQATKLEQRVGIEANINILRTSLNKLTDKKFLEIRETIINELNIIYSSYLDEDDNQKVCNMIYDTVSSNKFYSKVFVDLYTELINNYISIRTHFNKQIEFQNILSNYNNIQYDDPNTNYDKFCDNNKNNEKRRGLSLFYVNLALNNVIPKSTVVLILVELLKNVMEKINETGNKEIVDELTENVIILYNKDILNSDEIDEDDDEYLINDENITDVLTKLSESKVKNYKSLTSKSIFKYMDLLNV